MASLPACEAGRAISTAAKNCLCQDLASWYLSVSYRPLCVPVETIRHLNCAYFLLVLTAVEVKLLLCLGLRFLLLFFCSSNLSLQTIQLVCWR